MQITTMNWPNKMTESVECVMRMPSFTVWFRVKQKKKTKKTKHTLEIC